MRDKPCLAKCVLLSSKAFVIGQVFKPRIVLISWAVLGSIVFGV